MTFKEKAMCVGVFFWLLCGATIEWSFDNKNFTWMVLFAILGATSAAVALVSEET